MKYSVTAAFLLAALVLPAWCDNRDEAIYDTEGATLTNQVSPDHQTYESYSPPRQTPDRKIYYQQTGVQHYAMPQEHNQLNNYHQYRAQPSHYQNMEESALPNMTIRPKETDDDQEEAEKVETNVVYQQMKQPGNKYASYYNRPNMMMNGGQPQNFRHFMPKYTMEQQMQMQLQRQQMYQRMMAAQAAYMQQHQQPQSQPQHQQTQHQQQQQPQPQHQQPQVQHYAQPPAQQYVQHQPQQYMQQYTPTPAPVTSQAPSEAENYPANRPSPATVKLRYSPQLPTTPKPRYATPATTAQPWNQQRYYQEYEHSRQKE